MQYIQVYLSNSEYEALMARTREAGRPTAAEYIKSVMFPHNVFDVWYFVLVARAAEALPGSAFSVISLMGEDWEKIPKPTRLALGRVFRRQVDAGQFPGIFCTNPNSTHMRMYKKTESEKR
jgi:hypothetical protein